MKLTKIYPFHMPYHSSLAAISLLALFLLSACAPAPTFDPGPVYTSAAITAVAQFTRRAAGTAAVRRTQQAVPASPAFQLPTQTPPPIDTPLAPTDTPLPSDTPLPPAATLPPIPCNQLQFIADVSVPTNATLPLGAGFTKTWRVQNTGSCTWNAGYSLAFAGGDLMGAVPLALPGDVAPGQIADLSLRLVAPTAPGFYQAGWLLRDGANQTFGAGLSGRDPLAVSIRTIQLDGAASSAYDLSTVICAAAWSGPSGALGCPGIPGDVNGSVELMERANLETGVSSTYLLAMRHAQSVGSWISGRFPPYIVRSGDHFVTQIGCLADSPGCDLNFQVIYQLQNGASGALGNWREVYNGMGTAVDLDLSWLAGEPVTLLLTTMNNGPAAQANAFWLAPHIQNAPLPQNSLVLQWTRDDDPQFVCGELYIYNNGGVMKAQAFDCSRGRRDLGWKELSSSDQAQLLSWQQTLRRFDSEQYLASPNNPVITWLDFSGFGLGDAAESHITAINTLAERIFESMLGPH